MCSKARALSTPQLLPVHLPFIWWPQRHKLPLRKSLPGAEEEAPAGWPGKALPSRASSAKRSSPPPKLYAWKASGNFTKMKATDTTEGTASFRGLTKIISLKKIGREFSCSMITERSPKEKEISRRMPSRGGGLRMLPHSPTSIQSPGPAGPPEELPPVRPGPRGTRWHGPRRAGPSAAWARPGAGRGASAGPRYLVLIKASQLLRAHVFVASHDDPKTERPLGSDSRLRGCGTPAPHRLGKDGKDWAGGEGRRVALRPPRTRSRLGPFGRLSVRKRSPRFSPPTQGWLLACLSGPPPDTVAVQSTWIRQH